MRINKISKKIMVVDKQKHVGWCLIPPIILCDKRLGSTEKIILGRIFGLSSKYGYCNASNQYLGDDIGRSALQVSETLRELKNLSLIKIQGKTTDRKIYWNVPGIPLGQKIQAKSDTKNSMIEHMEKSSSLKDESMECSMDKSTPSIRDLEKDKKITESSDSDDIYSFQKKEVKTDTRLKNDVEFKVLISGGEFKKEQYDFSESGPFDWRYLINHGEGLTIPKFFVALYWREKSKDEYLGLRCSYKSRGLADGMMKREIKNAKELASMISFFDLKKLIKNVDWKFYDMFGKKQKEWNLKTICDNAYLVEEPDE